MRWIMPSSGCPPRSLVVQSEVTAFPAGWKGWPENPHAYDGPDGGRKGVCVRILPTTYAQLQSTQRRMGLRTVAAAWEFLLRLGLAAAERLPAR
jgi:hypothetical protein